MKDGFRMTATAVAMEYDQVDHVMCGDSVEENGFARNGVQIISLLVPELICGFVFELSRTKDTRRSCP